MKKFLMLLAAMTLVGIGYSQVDPETLNRQQQKEQQELLKQQQKEQEALEKQQQKEQEKALKEQEKAEADAEKAQRREQEKMMAKQAKKAHRAERREEIGRGLSFSIDPYVGLGANTNTNRTDIYAGWQEYLGAQAMLHYPLFKHWDLNVGLGVMAEVYCLRNNANFNTTNNMLDGETPSTFITETDYIDPTFIQLPIYFSHISDNSKYELYFGIKPAYNLSSVFDHVTVNNNDLLHTNITIPNNTMMNRFRCDVVLGSQKRFLIFDAGTEIFFNLLPTFINGNTSIHEFGVMIKL